jgi:hypothetical protein
MFQFYMRFFKKSAQKRDIILICKNLIYLKRILQGALKEIPQGALKETPSEHLKNPQRTHCWFCALLLKAQSA